MPEPSIYNFFNTLPEKLHSKMRERMTRRTLSDGDSVYRRDDDADAFYQIVHGKIRLSNVSKDGRELLYLEFSDGDCFGEVGLLDQSQRQHNAISSGTTELSALKKRDFDELCTEHPEIVTSLALILCAKLHMSWDLFESRTLLPLPQRLAQRIYDLTTSQSKEAKGKSPHDINLSQIDLAHMMGASRQAIGRILKRWEDQSLVHIHYGKITVIDLPEIKKIAREQ